MDIMLEQCVIFAGGGEQAGEANSWLSENFDTVVLSEVKYAATSSNSSICIIYTYDPKRVAKMRNQGLALETLEFKEFSSSSARETAEMFNMWRKEHPEKTINRIEYSGGTKSLTDNYTIEIYHGMLVMFMDAPNKEKIQQQLNN